ncbi:NUDIX domain-containing protein [Paenibacillus aquistagni]|uniref:NUDIX domain-containing protein n=1 Tax=Paenibacillus aquistagni TaxID=1852522 RepID=UPI003CC82B9B
MYDGLKREVFEETGLTITEIEGSQKRIDTCGINYDFEVECVEPYCVYQTIKGPVDSAGMYFICRAGGRLLIEGDDTANIRWISNEEVYQMMLDAPAIQQCRSSRLALLSAASL